MSTSTESPRAFAIVPAGGSSRRMGRDKLLLPWGEGVVIDAVIDAYQAAGVAAVVVVIQPGNAELIAHCRDRQVHVIVPPSPPAEMKDSVRLALAHVEQTFQPSRDDIWLLSPADLPTLSSMVICRLLGASGDHAGEILVPTHEGRRGHPTAFPWALAANIHDLSADEGVSALLGRHPVIEIDIGPAAAPSDIDTPQAYRRLRNDHG